MNIGEDSLELAAIPFATLDRLVSMQFLKWVRGQSAVRIQFNSRLREVSVQGVELKSEQRPAPQGRICGCKSGVKTTSRSQKQSTSDQLVDEETFA